MSRAVQNNVVARALSAAGIHAGNYVVLLDLFSTLSERQEFKIGRAEISRNVFVGVFATLTAFVNLLAIFGAHPALHAFVVVNYAATGYILLVTLVPEAVNTFLNPIETSLLAHQPIQDRAYSAAKITYLATVVAWIIIPLNAAPTLLGLHLEGARWFFPVSYLLSAYTFGMFTALLICAVIGVLLRILSPSKLRNIAAWMQTGMMLLFLFGPNAAIFLSRHGLIPSFSAGWRNPLNWFVAIATIGQDAQLIRLDWSGGLAMVICAVFLLYGIRSLSMDT